MVNLYTINTQQVLSFIFKVENYWKLATLKINSIIQVINKPQRLCKSTAPKITDVKQVVYYLFFERVVMYRLDQIVLYLQL